ncbi:MAG: hypothetical protein IKD11_01350, partial [Oscillospiraceae bacterium]|nr:hypothetical protein [Oscillospiraceae bacterium]
GYSLENATGKPLRLVFPETSAFCVDADEEICEISFTPRALVIDAGRQIQYIDAQDFVNFDTQATPEGVPVDDAWCAVCTLICDGCFTLASVEEV